MPTEWVDRENLISRFPLFRSQSVRIAVKLDETLRQVGYFWTLETARLVGRVASSEGPHSVGPYLVRHSTLHHRRSKGTLHLSSLTT